MKVSHTAAVLVGCSVLAATSTADVPVGAAGTGGKPGKMETASDMEPTAVSGGAAGKKKRAGSRALRGGHAGPARAADAEGGKTAKTHGGIDRTKTNRKKRSLKSSKSSSPGNGGGGGNGGGNGDNRAYTAAANGQMVDNTPYVNYKYDYLDRYSAYLTPEQLQKLRTTTTNNNTPPRDQETNVGGAEEAAFIATAPAGTTATATSSHSSHTQTAAVQQSGPATTPYVSTLNRQDGGQPDDSNDNERGYDATASGNADALNRGFEAEAEAPIAGYDPSTGYGSTGSNGGTGNANANTNGNGSGALDTSSTPARPIVQTTEWRPIDKSVWVEHYVPGVGSGPNNSNNNNGATTTFPNRNPSLSTGGGSANSNLTANRISASSAPCDGANPTASPSQGIQHVFEYTLWGTCSTTENGCRPGSCCLFHPTFHRGACVPFTEICESGERPGQGDCPYPWMTSNLCRCAGSGDGDGALPSF